MAWLLLLALGAVCAARGMVPLLFGLACQVKGDSASPRAPFFSLARARTRHLPFLQLRPNDFARLVGPARLNARRFPPQRAWATTAIGKLGCHVFGLYAMGWPSFAPVGFQGLTTPQLRGHVGAENRDRQRALWLAGGGAGNRRKRLHRRSRSSGRCSFVFASGVGAQYLVWLAPFFLLHSPRWYAAVTAASAVFLFAFYTTISHGLPWNRGISTADIPFAMGGVDESAVAWRSRHSLPRKSHAANPTLRRIDLFVVLFVLGLVRLFEWRQLVVAQKWRLRLFAGSGASVMVTLLPMSFGSISTWAWTQDRPLRGRPAPCRVLDAPFPGRGIAVARGPCCPVEKLLTGRSFVT